MFHKKKKLIHSLYGLFYLTLTNIKTLIWNHRYWPSTKFYFNNLLLFTLVGYSLNVRDRVIFFCAIR